MSREEIIHAYRHLYRGLLHAVQFATKGRFVARDQLRRAFRDKNATFDREAVKRTIWFVEAAARERGLEHKILKNLIKTNSVRYRPVPWRILANQTTMQKKAPQVVTDRVRENAFKHYDMTVAMLNKSMGLCLR
ncbi:DUF1763-domain-containing protein [Sodiomyces alkalinus F11]|uniref:DUF1763-domain-containing protein n=1 Tax=Sodiomyces alkalinus (strain CBS 110278 / VKM F-3762 / F11) TaxID=1314773 RepID=A0A3N2Q0I3_SODAK|nr:DUF1763-domain-containing protein [Sodiomyces alkalinus F11]ROT40252.1 DUF1763-domain-containing protein [Sodiomyces alkalinus F11]